MKNDIDSILDALFSGGKLNVGSGAKSRAAKDAEDFLNSIEKTNANMQSSLNRQISDLDKLTSDAQRSMDEMRRLLDAEGLTGTPEMEAPKAETAEKKPKAKGAEEPPQDPAQSFREAREATGRTVIGQDAFLDSLFTAFRRPSVTGRENGKPAAVVVISGKEGTGRHSALAASAAALCKEGVLKNGEVTNIDLSRYPNAEDGKLLTQDLFSALHSENDIVLFENFEQCHKSLLPMVAALCETGVLKLASRYALQKGMLIDVGTALVPDAVSEISVNGKYLVFLTSQKDSAFTDAFGAAFLSSVTDFCRTAEFTRESLLKIGEAALSALNDRTKAKLNYTFTFGEDASAFLADKFSRRDGVESMARLTERCFRLLSEEKLRRAEKDGKETVSGTLGVKDGVLMFTFPDFAVTVEEEKKQAADPRAAEEVKSELNEIIGLSEVKDYVLSLEQNYIIQRLREARGMKADVPTMHMIFTGNPGTGKTTIARLVSRYLKAMGVLSGGQLIEVTRADLVGKYVGHTAPLTQQVIRSALGGVLFIDEAYSLYRGADDSFGLEAIDTIVKGMEDHREDLIVILAGYTKEMEEFLTANSGLRSRFPNIIEFPDYTAEELLAITKLTAKKKGYTIDETCETPLLQYYEKRQATDARTAGNGRLVRNLVEDAILNQSHRLTGGDVTRLTEAELAALLSEDFDLSEG